MSTFLYILEGDYFSRPDSSSQLVKYPDPVISTYVRSSDLSWAQISRRLLGLDMSLKFLTVGDLKVDKTIVTAFVKLWSYQNWVVRSDYITLCFQRLCWRGKVLVFVTVFKRISYSRHWYLHFHPWEDMYLSLASICSCYSKMLREYILLCQESKQRLIVRYLGVGACFLDDAILKFAWLIEKLLVSGILAELLNSINLMFSNYCLFNTNDSGLWLSKNFWTGPMRKGALAASNSVHSTCQGK